MVSKYVELWHRAIVKSLAYRTEAFLWLVLDTLPVLVACLVWVNVFQHRSDLVGFTLGSLVQYYLFTNLLNGLTASHFEQWRVEQIRQGKIDFYLTKPLSYLQEIFWSEVGGKTFFGIMSLAFFLLLSSLVNIWITLPALTSSWTSWLLVIGLLIGAYLAEFLFALEIVLLGFWFEASDGLQHFKWITVGLLSGGIIPIAMMPEALRSVVNALPFKYMYAVPIGIAQGTVTMHFWQVSYFFLFLVASWAVVQITWNFARKKYSSAG